jgi:hypothetical protein
VDEVSDCRSVGRFSLGSHPRMSRGTFLFRMHVSRAHIDQNGRERVLILRWFEETDDVKRDLE